MIENSTPENSPSEMSTPEISDARKGASDAQGEEPRTILAVENDILIRLTISAYLRDCGYRVIEAVSAEEALIILREPGLHVDIVLCDAVLAGEGGGMDGFALARWIRANRPDIPTILAGSAARAAEKAADLCEAGPLLSKPYEPQILLDRVKQRLAERARVAHDSAKPEPPR